MAWYYICGSATENEAQDALNEINSSNWFPIVGQINGNPAPQNCQTSLWCEDLTETIDGRFVFPLIPMERLMNIGVSQEEISQWITDHNVTWEDIPTSEIKQVNIFLNTTSEVNDG